jgi:hypothetical protein
MLKVNAKERPTTKDVVEHPWVRMQWDDNVANNVDDDRKKLKSSFSSIRFVREKQSALNAFELISLLTSDTINSLALENYLGTTTRHFMCRGDPTSVGQRLKAALLVAQGNPETTKVDFTELSGFVSVSTGVLVFNVFVSLTIGNNLSLVAIHRLRGTENEFIDFSNLVRVQLGDILVTKQSSTPLEEPTLNAFELMAVLNKMDLGGLQQQDLMKAIPQRDAIYLIQSQKLNNSKSLATCTQNVLSLLRDNLKVTAFSEGDWSIVGHINAQPLMTFTMTLHRIPAISGKVLIRIELGQGHYTTFKAFLPKLSSVLSEYK